MWLKVYPLMVQVRHMFYGMLPLPLCKSTSPLRTLSNNAAYLSKGKQPVLPRSSDRGQTVPILPVQSASNFPMEDQSVTELDVRTINRLCAAASSENHQHSEVTDQARTPHPIASNSLLPVIDIISDSSLTRNQTTANSQVSLSHNFVFNAPVSTKAKTFSTLIQKLTEEQSETQDYAEIEHVNNHDQATNSRFNVKNDVAKGQMQKQPGGLPGSYSNPEADRFDEAERPSEVTEHVYTVQDDIGSSLVHNDTMGRLKNRGLTVNEELVTCDNLSYANKVAQTNREMPEIAAEPKTHPGLSVRFFPNSETSKCRQNLSASGRLTALYVDAIRMSISPQGLWLILDPRQVALNEIEVTVTDGQKITVCNHPECQGKWNLDDSDDDSVYTEAPEAFSFSNARYPRVSSAMLDTQICERDWQKLRKILSTVARSDKDQDNPGKQVTYKQSKMLCFPAKLAGVHTYGETSQVVYQSGPLTRSSGSLR